MITINLAPMAHRTRLRASQRQALPARRVVSPVGGCCMSGVEVHCHRSYAGGRWHSVVHFPRHKVIEDTEPRGRFAGICDAPHTPQ